MLNRIWKILNYKQHFFFLEKRKPVLKEKTYFFFAVFVIGISVIGYCLVFRISNLGFNKGGGDD